MPAISARAERPVWAAEDANDSPNLLSDAAASPTTSPSSSVTSPLLADDTALTDENIYSTGPIPRSGEGVNNGGAHLDLNVAYGSSYVYRGVNHDNVTTHGNSLNLLMDGKLSFDFDRYPHPFVGVFTNTYDSDPVSRFQEVRPYYGLTWNLRPFLLEAGNTNYIYPQREQFDASEVYGKVTIDDSLLFNTEQPIFSPYVMGAYDYHTNKGWYVEMGVNHDFEIPDWGLVVSPYAALAYISRFQQQFDIINNVQDTGWQHAEYGLKASYSLNTLLNISSRYGEFDLVGFMIYDQKISRDITADNILWGGGGIHFKY